MTGRKHGDLNEAVFTQEYDIVMSEIQCEADIFHGSVCYSHGMPRASTIL